MNLLLDIDVFLWWDMQAKTLNADTRAVIADPANQIFVSAVSIWEIAIKRRLGKLDFRGSAVAAISANGFHELPILPIDAENAGALAPQRPDRPHAGRAGEASGLHAGNRRRGDQGVCKRAADVGRLTSTPLPLAPSARAFVGGTRDEISGGSGPSSAPIRT